MSHYCVMVIGNNPEAQLQKFHEFECTGIVDQYVQSVDLTNEFLQRVRERQEKESDTYYGALESELEFYGLDEKIVMKEADADTSQSGEHKYGYAVIDRAVYKIVNGKQSLIGGKLIKVIIRTNPDKKWDWAVLGGRYKGLLLLKDNSRADFALKREIDIERMQDEAEKQAIELWGKIQHIEDVGFITYSEAVEKFKNDYETARQYYRNQEFIIKATEALAATNPCFDFDVLRHGKEKYIKSCRDSALTTFAVVKNGEWIQRGEMGWFGTVRNEKDLNEWSAEFMAGFNELPDDTLMSIYDCHI